MTLEDAYRILGLDKNAPKKEIKKTYRTLSKKYHPDMNETKSKKERQELEEKFKEIGSAYEKIMKEMNFSKEENSPEINKDKEILSEKLCLFLNSLLRNTDFFINMDKQLRVDYKNILREIKQYLAKIQQSNSLQELNTLSVELEQSIEKFLKQVEKYYLKHYSISINKKINLDYNCSTLEEFLEQLEEIKKNYRKEINKNMEIAIDKIIEEYQLYAGFDLLEKQIQEIKKEYVKKIKKSLKNKESLLLQMKRKIERMFNSYFEHYTKWNAFANITLDEISIKEIKQLDILKNAIGTDRFDSLYLELAPIKNKAIYKKQEKEIKDLFIRLHNKSYQAMQSLSFTNEFSKITLIQKIEEEIVKIFERAKNGLLDIEKLVVLENITFTDFENDFHILYSLRYKVNKNDIYIMKDKKEEKDSNQIKWLEIENSWYYMYSFQAGYIPEIARIQYSSLEQIEKEYFSLKQFFDYAKPVFYKTNNWFVLYSLMTKSDMRYCCILDDDTIDISLWKIWELPNTGAYPKEKQYFKEKENIINRIVEQVNMWKDDFIEEEIKKELNRRK